MIGFVSELPPSVALGSPKIIRPARNGYVMPESHAVVLTVVHRREDRLRTKIAVKLMALACCVLGKRLDYHLEEWA